MYLLTMGGWEGGRVGGPDGKYVARGQGLRTMRHDQDPNIFPSGPT